MSWKIREYSGHIRHSLWLLFCITLLLVLSIRIYQLQQRINTLPLVSQPDDTEDALLFEKLLKAELITSLSDGRLKLVPSDAILIQKAEHAQNPDLVPLDLRELKAKERLINDLYHTKAGEVVRNQVKLWNGTRIFTAIRDNRPGQKDFQNQWHINHEGQGAFFRTSRLVPESFGFVNNGHLEPRASANSSVIMCYNKNFH